MPLWQGKTTRAFKHNLKELLASGRKKKQALAIAYSVKRRKAKRKRKTKRK